MLTTAVTATCLLVAYCTWSYALKLKSVNHLPGMRPLLSSLSPFGALLPTCWWNPGLNWSWLWRKTIYFNYQHEVISMVPLIGQPAFYTCSLSVVKQLLKEETKSGVFKPAEMAAAISCWGPNVLSDNGDIWKRHRRIVGPAFTANTYNLVWRETSSLYEDMSAEWENEKVDTVRNINQHLNRFALAIISRCGFGLPMAWEPASTEHAEGEMSSTVALQWVSATSIARVFLPRWSYQLPLKWLRDMDHAWSLFGEYMNTLVDSKAQELSGSTDGGEHAQRGDVFTRLVAAMDTSAKIGLTKQEVIGNTFTLMFAGHETTARVLSATLGFLAIHQDEQEKAYQEILAATPSDRELGLEDIPKLTHTMACFHESSRMYPAANVLVRDVAGDMTVHVTSPALGTVIFPKGSRIMIDMIAIHHNPQIFPEPDMWRPSRWYCVSEHDISMFGYGPRACIGRKFGEVEAACFLTHLLRQWKLDIDPPKGETRERYEERVMGNAMFGGLTFGVGPVDVKLTARK